MSDSEQTRFVRLAADVDRAGARNQGTRVCRESECVVLVDHRAIFNHHQRRLHQVLRELDPPGVAVFAIHPRHGIAGRLWLAATAEVRAGTVGRHSEVDLYLPHDEELSLRHLLVLVKASTRGQRIQVLDLATPGGFQAEQGGVLRAVDANGTLILRAANYSLFVFPTGAHPPWNPAAEDPWLTLPQRVVVADERVAPRRDPPRIGRLAPEKTAIELREGPSEPGPAPLLEADERLEGHLVLGNGRTEGALAVGARALDRGIILGRYARCTGDTLVASQEVSRVHAMFIRVDGSLHIVDTGSTNGTSEKREVKCEQVVAGRTYGLGRMRARWEPVQ